MSVLLTIGSILAFFALTLGTAFFVAAEFSLAALEKSTVRSRAEEGDRRDRAVAAVHGRLSFQLSSCQVGITITTLLTGFLAEPLIARLVHPVLEDLGVPEAWASPISIAFALVLATYLSMVIGELVPKNYAITHPVPASRLIAAPLAVFSKVFWVLIRSMDVLAIKFVNRLGLDPDEHAARSSAELGALVRSSVREGSLDSDTAVILERSLRFGDLTAEDIMTPRSTVQTLNAGDTVADLVDLAKTTGYSRFPVIHHDLDDTRGVVHIKQALTIPGDELVTTNVGTLVQSVARVPASLDGDAVLESIRAEGAQVLLVVDEYGGVAGLVTLEDVIEEIVGNVTDEYDTDEERDVVRRGGDWELSGLLRPDEVAHAIGYHAPEGDYETIAGVVVKALGRLPEVDDVAVLPGMDNTMADEFESGHFGRWQARVLSLDGRRIDRLLLGPREDIE